MQEFIGHDSPATSANYTQLTDKFNEMASTSANLSKVARRQREQWGLGIGKFHRLPYLKEAKQSAFRYTNRRWGKEFESFKKKFPANWPPSMYTNFLSKNNYVLNEYQDEILKAAKENNVEFFIALGKVVRMQRDGRFASGKDRNKPMLCTEYVARFWTEGLLWLMTDKTVVKYLNLILGQPFNLAQYRVDRRRLNLYRHPDSPIIDILVSDIRTSESYEAVNHDVRSFKLKLKRGWTLAEGRLTAG